MSNSTLVQEITLQNLLALNKNFSEENFIDLLDFLNDQSGPKVLDLLKNVGIDPHLSVLDIERQFNKNLQDVMLDYVLKELVMSKNFGIVFLRLKLDANLSNIFFKVKYDKFFFI